MQKFVYLKDLKIVLEMYRLISFYHTFYFAQIYSFHNHSAQKCLSSRLLSRKFIFNIYETIILPVVLYGCQTWSLTLKAGH
jgi:hypothetical protein